MVVDSAESTSTEYAIRLPETLSNREYENEKQINDRTISKAVLLNSPRRDAV